MKKILDRHLIQVVLSSYHTKATNLIRLIDNFICFVVFIFLIILCNFFILGSFPFNAFLGAIYCCLGMFASTLALRLRISNAEKHFDGKKDIPKHKKKTIMKSIFFEYVCCVIIINIFCVTYMP